MTDLAYASTELLYQLGPIAALPDVDPAVVAAGLALGVTVDDIAWLASTPLGALTDALDDLRVSGYVDPAAARQLADMDTPRRRLVLAMSQLEDFPLVAGLAVAAALEDAAWIDTLTTLILDGTPVYEAIALARADHRIEQERVEQQRVVTVTRAVGPAGRAVTGSS